MIDRCPECLLTDGHAPDCNRRGTKVQKPKCAKCGRLSWRLIEKHDRWYCRKCWLVLDGENPADACPVGGDIAPQIRLERIDLSDDVTNIEPPPPPSPKQRAIEALKRARLAIDREIAELNGS